MPRTYRRYIFFTFLGVFALTAPLLILYTAGYRYNWERGKIQETGVLLTNYRPTTALLQLNNVVGAKKAPARFSGLIPGRYTITIEKEGYYPWQKRLWVEPSKTTFAEHMILWKKDSAPERVSLDAPSLSVQSPNKKYITLITKKNPATVALFDTRTKKIVDTITPPQKKSATITNILWSPNGRRLFIESANSEQFIATIETEHGSPIALTKFSTERLLRVTWNTDDDDRLYGYTRAAPLKPGYQLLEIDLFRGATQTASVGVLPNITPYFVEDDLFYRVEQGVLSITSFAASKQALERRLALPDAPTNKVTFLSNGPDTMITLFDQEHKRILLIDKGTATLYPIQETIDGVVDALWSPQKNRLLWNTGKTLALLDLEQSTREVIVEETKKIHAMAWDPENEYVFYAAGDTVTVTEIDDRDARNRVPLITIPELQGIMVSTIGNTLFAQGRDGISPYTITDR
ncbi:MAG: PEGA domain-containing protein [bacterium]|nr:PEGA domain-containing protein [bacterium]